MLIICMISEICNSLIVASTSTRQIPDADMLVELAVTFKALAHPGRLAMVHALADGPVCACDLAKVANSSNSTASRHLTVLRHAGIISSSRRGQQIFYTLERPCLLQIMDCSVFRS